MLTNGTVAQPGWSARLITEWSRVQIPSVPYKMLQWCSPANHAGLSSPRLGFKSRLEHFILGKFYPCRGCRAWPKTQDLESCPVVVPGFKSLPLHYCGRGGVVAILGDCGSPDPGSIPGPGPISFFDDLTVFRGFLYFLIILIIIKKYI